MQISSYSGGGEAQRLLAALTSQQTQQTDASSQTASGVDGTDRPKGPPPGGPHFGHHRSEQTASSQFSSDVLSELLSAQQAPPTADDLANKLISDVDSDGDGSLSLDEIKTALGVSSTDASASTTSSTESSDTSATDDPLAQAIAKLDTDGDGKLSSAELASALEAFRAAHDPSHKAEASTSETAA